MKSLPSGFPTTTTATKNMAAFLNKIGSGKSCSAFIYDGLQVVAFCFETSGDNQKYIKKLKKCVTGNGAGGEILDPTQPNSFKLQISDGEGTVKEVQVKFDETGMHTDGFNLKPNAIDPYGGNKCHVEHGVKIIPPSLLKKKIENPYHVILFNQDDGPKYMAYIGTNAVNVMKYVSERLRNTCRNQVAGEDGKFVNDLKSNPTKGVYNGWVYYTQINDDQRPIDEKPKMASISPEGISIQTDASDSISVKENAINIELEQLLWLCDSEGGCSLPEFKQVMQKTGNPKIKNKAETLQKTVTEKWNQQDANLCTVICLQNEVYHLFCPTDLGEEVGLKTAISVALDMHFIDGPADSLVPAKEGDVFNVMFMDDDDNGSQEAHASTTPRGLVNLKDQTLIVDPTKMKAIDGVDCGIEFRDPKLPPALSNMDSNNCFKIKAKKNRYICVAPVAKAYIKQRKIITYIKKLCGGGEDLVDSVDTIEQQLPVVSADFYSNKGSPQHVPSEVKLNNNQVSISGQGSETKAGMEQMILGCGGNVCSMSEYMSNQTSFASQKYEQGWINNFKQKMEESGASDSNTIVMTVMNNSTKLAEPFFLRLKDKKEVNKFKKSIKKMNNNKLSKMDPNTSEYDKVPAAAMGEVFPVYLSSSSGLNSGGGTKPKGGKAKIKMTGDGVIYESSGQSLLKYKDIVKDDFTFNIEGSPSNLPDNIPSSVDKSLCCGFNPGMTVFICAQDHQGRAKIASKIRQGAQKYARTMKSKKKAGMLDPVIPPPNDFFNISVEYNDFGDGTINEHELENRTFDNSNDGEFSGWVTFKELGESSSSESPKHLFQFISIKNGMMLVKKNERAKPQLTVDLSEIKHVGKVPPSPSEYTSKGSTSDPEMNMSFGSEINKATQGNPNADKSCCVSTFCDPAVQKCKNYLLCAITPNFGLALKTAIKNGSKKSEIHIDIKRQIDVPAYKNKIFQIVYFKKGEIVSEAKYAYLEKDGLCYQESKPNPDQDKTYDCTKIKLKEIKSDKFGNSSAIWYKQLNVKHANKGASSAVQSNDCCFAFYTGQANDENEFCVSSADGTDCKKEAYSLMKGVKKVASEQKASNFSDEANGGVSQSDMIKTVDDSSNGNFEGFGYSIKLDDPNPSFSNPSKISINNQSMSLSGSQDSSSSADVKYGNLEFNCEGGEVCNLENFKKLAQTNDKYRNKLQNYQVVLNEFKKNYPTLADSMEQSASVIEMKEGPIMICPEYPEHGASIRKAIKASTHIHNYTSDISDMVDPTPSDQFPIRTDFSVQTEKDRFLGNSNPSDEVKNTKLKQDGLYDVKTDEKIIGFDLDGDVNTQEKCSITHRDVNTGISECKPGCSIQVNQGGAKKTICIIQQTICTNTTAKLVKGFDNGCRNGNPFGNQNSNSIKNGQQKGVNSEILGQSTPWTPVNPFDPSSKNYAINESKRTGSGIMGKDTAVTATIEIDENNEVSSNTKDAFFKGNFNVYMLPFQNYPSDSSKSTYFGVIAQDRFTFYNDSGMSKQVMQVRMGKLGFNWNKKMTSVSNFAEGIDASDSLFVSWKTYIPNIMNSYQNGDDTGCTVVQQIVEDVPKYFICCIEISRADSTLTQLEAELEKLDTAGAKMKKIAGYHGDKFQQAFWNSYLLGTKYMHLDPISTSQIIPSMEITKDGTKSHLSNVQINDEGIYANGSQFFQFKDAKNCVTYTNVQYIPKQYQVMKQECCAKFTGKMNLEYACVLHINCQYWIQAFIGSYYKRCSSVKGNQDKDFLNELHIGGRFDWDKALSIVKSQPININGADKSDLEKHDNSQLNLNTFYRSKVFNILKSVKRGLLKAGRSYIEKATKVEDSYKDFERAKQPADANHFIKKAKGPSNNSEFSIEIGEGDMNIFRENNAQKRVFGIKGMNIFAKSTEYLLGVMPVEKYLFIDLMQDGMYFELSIPEQLSNIVKDPSQLKPNSKSFFLIQLECQTQPSLDWIKPNIKVIGVNSKTEGECKYNVVLNYCIDLPLYFLRNKAFLFKVH